MKRASRLWQADGEARRERKRTPDKALKVCSRTVDGERVELRREVVTRPEEAEARTALESMARNFAAST